MHPVNKTYIDSLAALNGLRLIIPVRAVATTPAVNQCIHIFKISK